MDLSHYGLYPHQVAGVLFLARRGRAILGDDMGLCKTRQAVVALKASAPEGVFLVVCPASLELDWAREIRAVDPDARIEVIGVPGHAHPRPQWVVVNYDLLADGTLDGYIALLQEAKAARAGGQKGARLEIVGEIVAALHEDTPLLASGSWEFPSSSDPGRSYRVSFGRGGHPQCTCPGFEYRGSAGTCGK